MKCLSTLPFTEVSSSYKSDAQDFPGFPQPKVPLVKAFFTVDNENRQLEDLSLADFGHVPELISSVVKDKLNKWEFCM